MWSPGNTWRVAKSLNKLNEQIRAYAPRSVPPATDVNSWGALADQAHQKSSDHYPHYYSALGGTAVVCARDFPNAPSLGLNAWTVCDHMRKARDPRVGYIICNGKITGPNHNWQWDDYTGDDPHDTHFHVSSVHTAAADDARPWSLPPSAAAAKPSIQGETDMIYTVTNVPAGALDCEGKPVVNNSRCLATPNGPFGLTGTEAGSLPNPAYWDANSVDMTWTRLQDLCANLLQDPPVLVIDDATRQALAVAAGQAIKDAIGTSLEARLTAWAQSPEGKAALVAAANVAEDS
jgi:hypothetical protein